LNPNNDILTSDIGTNQQIMCWLMDTYSEHFNDHISSVVTGKPLDLGGIKYSVFPVALGVNLCIKKACQHLDLDLAGSKAAVQGFGKVGMSVARLLSKAGVRVIAIADVSGAYVNERGINIEEAIWHQQSYGILDGLEGEMAVEKMDDPSKIFELKVDILVPAAIELQITNENVSSVEAKIIAEAAHDPISPRADQKLYEKGTLIIPDILCNSGGIAGSYLEWVQNRMGYYWTAERMDEEVTNIVGRAFDKALDIAVRDSIPLRLAAATLAVKRVADTARLRGVYA
jgi:glutamate dehydrogenase (NAD(P)+)